jgi:hypothetical protein
MSSAAVVGTGIYIGSGYQRPSVSILGEGVGSGGGDKVSSKDSDQKISQNGQLQSHSISVENSSVGTPSSSPSKTGCKVSAPVQLQSQFLPAAHWHGSSVPVVLSQKSPSVATGVMPAGSQYQSSPFPGSPAHTEVSSVSAL